MSIKALKFICIRKGITLFFNYCHKMRHFLIRILLYYLSIYFSLSLPYKCNFLFILIYVSLFFIYVLTQIIINKRHLNFIFLFSSIFHVFEPLYSQIEWTCLSEYEFSFFICGQVHTHDKVIFNDFKIWLGYIKFRVKI